jgi:Domain of unknown function (DUF4386)
MSNSLLPSQTLARATGGVYIILTVAALFAEFFVRGQLIVRGDAIETAQRIASAERLFRLGIAADIVTLLCDAILAVLLYRLLKPVGDALALVAMSLRFAMVALAGTGVALSILALRLIDSGLSGAETNTLTLVALESRSQVANGAMAFFGTHLIVVGCLVAHSGYLPRLFGVLLALAGLTYLIHSFASLLAPGLLRPFFPYYAGLWALSEWSFTLWLIFVGVRNRSRPAAASAD